MASSSVTAGSSSTGILESGVMIAGAAAAGVLTAGAAFTGVEYPGAGEVGGGITGLGVLGVVLRSILRSIVFVSPEVGYDKVSRRFSRFLAEAGRLSGSFARHAMTISDNARGTSGRRVISGGGSCVRTAARTFWGEVAA